YGFDGGRASSPVTRLYGIKLSFADRSRLYLFHTNPVRGIRAGVAGRAIARLSAIFASLLQTFQREIGQRLSADEVPNLFDGLICGNQLFFGRCVHADRKSTRLNSSHLVIS